MYQTIERVGPSRTDKDARLRLVSAIDIMQDCSQLWLESEPEFHKCLVNNGWAMVMAFRQVDIIRLPEYQERLSAKTSIFECKKYYGYRNTAVYDEKNEPCLKSWSLGAFVDLATGKFAAIPPEVLASITLDEKLDMDYQPKKITLPDSRGDRMAPKELRRSDIDINNHVNNARYIDIAQEVLPEDFEVKRIRAEYKTSAVWGDSIHPRRHSLEEGWIVSLENEQEEPYAIIEFVS